MSALVGMLAFAAGGAVVALGYGAWRIHHARRSAEYRFIGPDDWAGLYRLLTDADLIAVVNDRIAFAAENLRWRGDPLTPPQRDAQITPLRELVRRLEARS